MSLPDPAAGEPRLDGMVAVVTGASGFIGSHLLDTLLAGGARVHVIVRDGARAIESPAPAARAGVTVHRCDLLDERSVIELPAWREATHCFHVGGVTKARTRAAFDAGNVTPTRHLCAAMARQSRPTLRLVYVSSQAAAGPATSTSTPVREDDAPHPVEAYGASKLAAEQVVALHGALYETMIIRPAAVYGPRDRDFLAAFKQASGRIAVHAVPRTHAITMVHVADLIRALVLAAVTPMTRVTPDTEQTAGSSSAARCYFVGHATPVTWGALYGEIARAAGTHPYEIAIPHGVLRAAAWAADALGALTGGTALLNGHKVALAAPRWWLCDATRAQTELGWSARVPLTEGVRETLAWYRAVGWLSAGQLRAGRQPEGTT